jgi:3-methyladenine DNA glycosylase AlkC
MIITGLENLEMGSTSSKASIVQRMHIRFSDNTFFSDLASDREQQRLFDELESFLKSEYNAIAPEERLGKGAVYLAKAIASDLLSYFSSIAATPNFIEICNQMFDYARNRKFEYLHVLAPYLLAAWVGEKEGNFDHAVPEIEKWADHEDWMVRETAGGAIIAGLKRNPKLVLKQLMLWACSTNENLRRLASESVRPWTEIKWMRDPTKNDDILKILWILRKYSSEYVRKSVGNNLKDLSKYMPEKILTLLEKWIEEQKLTVVPDLASKSKAALGNDAFYLVWTIKQALRWLQERNPEYHPRIQAILGENYVKYFHEKKNWLAKPTG